MGRGRVERDPGAPEAGGGTEPDPGGIDGFASLGPTGGIIGIGLEEGIDGGVSEGGGIDGGCIDDGGGIERGVAGGIDGGCIDDGGGMDRGVAGEELVGAGGIERVFFGRGGTSGAGGGGGAGTGRATGVRCGGRGTAFFGGSSSLAIRQRSVHGFATVR